VGGAAGIDGLVSTSDRRVLHDNPPQLKFQPDLTT